MDSGNQTIIFELNRIKIYVVPLRIAISCMHCSLIRSESKSTRDQDRIVNSRAKYFAEEILCKR